jgi:lysosomal acid lipase/cholesteryl ester hydrolase
VFDALESFSDAQHSKEEYDRYHSARRPSLGRGTARPYISEDEGSQTYDEVATVRDAYTLATSRDYNLANGFSSPGMRKKATIQEEYDESSADTSPVTPTHFNTMRVEDMNGTWTPAKEDLQGMCSGSNVSIERGSRGISLDAGDAVGNMTTSSDEDSGRQKRRKK